jgi:hypothetical protein
MNSCICVSIQYNRKQQKKLSGGIISSYRKIFLSSSFIGLKIVFEVVIPAGSKPESRNFTICKMQEYWIPASAGMTAFFKNSSLYTDSK